MCTYLSGEVYEESSTEARCEMDGFVNKNLFIVRKALLKPARGIFDESSRILESSMSLVLVLASVILLRGIDKTVLSSALLLTLRATIGSDTRLIGRCTGVTTCGFGV